MTIEALMQKSKEMEMGPMVQISLRIPGECYAQVCELADRFGITVSEVMRLSMQEAVAESYQQSENI